MKFQICFPIWISLEKKFGAIVSWVLENLQVVSGVLIDLAHGQIHFRDFFGFRMLHHTDDFGVNLLVPLYLKKCWTIGPIAGLLRKPIAGLLQFPVEASEGTTPLNRYSFLVNPFYISTDL